MDVSVPSAKNFLSQFVELYDANETFRESLVMYLAKTTVFKLTSSCNNPGIK